MRHGVDQRLAELLSVISDANEFSTAAAFLVAQFADIANASRGCVLTIDPQQRQIETVASVGFSDRVIGRRMLAL